MKHTSRRRTVFNVAAVLASMALLAGCANSNGSGATGAPEAGGDDGAMLATESKIIGDQDRAAEPVDGGTLSFAGYSMPNSLDPTVTQPSGATGGTEMASIYGLLMRYDPPEDAFVPQLAKSLDESDDHLTYTLALRDDVQFSDGTPMDARAVVDSINRYNDEHGANSELFLQGVAKMEATDTTTVVFHLNHPWKEFPALLTFGHGMIIAPSGYADPDHFQPIGAGPYTIESFAPGNLLTVAARDDWWNGAPHLATIKFVDIQGDQAKLEALNSGGIQMAYLRNAEQVKTAISQYPGYTEPISLTGMVNINNREGHPGANAKVREAMAYAIDPALLNQRAQNGLGSPGKLIFQSWSQWHNAVEPTPTDVDKAAELLEQAKADGFDGNVEYLSLNSPSSKDTALAIQALLDNVGFTTHIEFAATAADLVKRLYVDHDFDLSFGSRSISEAIPSMRLAASLRSDSANNFLGYNSPEMDRLLDSLQQATSNDAEREAIAAIQNQVNEDVPFVATGAGTNFVPWTANIHGAVPSTDGIMLLGDAWMN